MQQNDCYNIVSLFLKLFFMKTLNMLQNWALLDCLATSRIRKTGNFSHPFSQLFTLKRLKLSYATTISLIASVLVWGKPQIQQFNLI